MKLIVSYCLIYINRIIRGVTVSCCGSDRPLPTQPSASLLKTSHLSCYCLLILPDVNKFNALSWKSDLSLAFVLFVRRRYANRVTLVVYQLL